MKFFLLLGVLFLVACSKQDNSHQEIEKSTNQENSIEKALAFVSEQKKNADSYAQTDQAVYLDMLNMVEPYRVCRRLNILRDYSDDKIKIYP